MPEILALLQNIAPLLDKTTFRQMSQVIFGMNFTAGAAGATTVATGAQAENKIERITITKMTISPPCSGVPHGL